jgi:hypothetical protein
MKPEPPTLWSESLSLDSVLSKMDSAYIFITSISDSNYRNTFELVKIQRQFLHSKSNCGLKERNDLFVELFLPKVKVFSCRGNFRERLGRPYKKGAPCSQCPKHCRLKKLCTNSCPSADLWANCRELNSTWHDWLCHSHSHEGRDRHRYCSATCNCHDKVI